MGKSTSNLNRRPRPWEYLIEDQVTRQIIYNTDAEVDFWGRVVHKDWVTQPTPYEYKDAFFPEVFPDFGRAPADPSGLPGNYFISHNGNSIWYSTDYSSGQYRIATPAQVASVLLIVPDQTFTYDYNGNTDVRAVGTMAITDPSGYGETWSIAPTATDPFNNTTTAFSINSATGTIYASDLNLLEESTSYTLQVTATSYYPGNLATTATVTVNVTTIAYAPLITTPTPIETTDTTTAVATIVGVPQ
jgi:hypothetical protein